MIKKILSYKKLNSVDIDSGDRITVHDEIFKKKNIIRDIFIEFHNIFLKYEKQYLSMNGLRVELGSGVYPIKNTDNNVISSDVVKNKKYDLVVNAEKMNFKDSSISTIFMQNVFHHIGNPENFFNESNRVLMKGGGLILVEPYYNFLSTIIYNNISKNEFFDKKQKSWSNNTKSMSGANQALSYNIFIRDFKKFSKKYKNFEIVEIKPLNNYLRYIFSGGLNFKQLLPSWLFFFLKIIEFILNPLKHFFAIHYIIVIKKVD